MSGIKFPIPLAKGKIAERSCWRSSCVAQIFQVSARASRAPPALGTDRRVGISNSTSYTVSSAGEREKEEIKGWEAQMVSLGTINALIKGH